MKRHLYYLGSGLIAAGVVFAARGDEHFDTLKAGNETYSNITVTSVSATDIYFTSPRGMGNVKLKKLDPALQKHFGYDAGKAAAMEESNVLANAEYRQEVLQQRKSARVIDETRPNPRDQDFVAPQLYARSVRGQSVPYFLVEKWLTPEPEIHGKFVLINFWRTTSAPCRNAIPTLNEFQGRFRYQLVVIGLTDEPEDKVRQMTDPHIDFAVATDTQARLVHTLQIVAVPHCILIDPRGIVRYEGNPAYLDDAKLRHFLDKYDVP